MGKESQACGGGDQFLEWQRRSFSKSDVCMENREEREEGERTDFQNELNVMLNVDFIQGVVFTTLWIAQKKKKKR